MKSLDELQNWYLSMCNGDWEHTYGITIETLDNPGWDLRIELTDTGLENRSFEKLVRQGENQDDWVFCKKEGQILICSGGPLNLNEIIQVFLKWANS